MLSVIESFFGTARETPVANSQGDGGNITIDHVFVVLDVALVQSLSAAF
jgi:hypothetical protein